MTIDLYVSWRRDVELVLVAEEYTCNQEECFVEDGVLRVDGIETEAVAKINQQLRESNKLFEAVYEANYEEIDCDLSEEVTKQQGGLEPPYI